MTRAYDPCMTLVGVNEYSVIVSKFRFELTPTLLNELRGRSKLIWMFYTGLRYLRTEVDLTTAAACLDL